MYEEDQHQFQVLVKQIESLRQFLTTWQQKVLEENTLTVEYDEIQQVTIS